MKMNRPKIRRVIQSYNLSDTLCLYECHPDHGHRGWWLWDETRGMNLAMKASSQLEAVTEALTYYQKRLERLESDHAELSQKVHSFVSQFTVDEDD